MTYKQKISQSDINIITDVICNRCGHSCLSEDCHEYATLKALWQHGKYSQNGESHEAHLCQDCFDIIVADFQYTSLKSTDVF